MSEYSRALPPLGTLVVFEAAYRHRNFSRAANELNYSQATVSRRIAELERDLGTTLFERRRHDVVPTHDAEILAASVRNALGDLSATANLIRRRNSDVATLTIFTDHSLASAVVAPIVGDLQRTHRDLTIRVLSSWERVETTREPFDVALQVRTGDPSPYEVYPVADDAVFPVCSPAFAKRHGDHIGVGELAALPLLHVDYDSDWTDWASFLRFVGLDGDPPSHGMTFSSYQVCLDVAERGEGVALGWERTVLPRMEAGNLVALTDFTMPHPGIINAYLPPGRDNDPHVRDFLDRLGAAIKPLGSDPV